MSLNKQVRRIAIVGTGVIGASWTAQYLARGFDVIATDPAHNAEESLRKYVDEAWPALTDIGLSPGAATERLSFTENMKEALTNADFVQENGPERPDFKIKLFAEIDEATPPDSIIASSSSGLTMTVIQSACKRPERCVIGHPFNPPHIIPLVEVVGGSRTSAEVIQRAIAFYASIGKKPIYLRKEFPGHVANRLQAALYREILYLIQQGVLSVAEADDAVSYGPGLRWGVMGPSLLWHLGGGPGGIQHFMEHLMDPLTGLMKALGNPDVTDELKQTIIEGVLHEAGARSVDQLAQEENETLVGLLKLRAKNGEAAVASKTTVEQVSKSTRRGSNDNGPSDRIFFLDVSGGRLVSVNTDGSDLEVILNGLKRIPDGIEVDVEAGHIYWTNMGNPAANDGSIERVDVDGQNRQTIIPEGGTYTPKQIKLDKRGGKLYWSDREGMRVMRANFDGSNIETLVETGHGERDRRDQRNWCVGIAVDPEHGKIYWTQKGPDNAGEGSILRTNIELPKGETPANRTDIELLLADLPEPIDLDLDLNNRMIYWTDRGNPPLGNTVSRAPIETKSKAGTEHEIVISGLMEGIGLALDSQGGRMFFADLAGSVYSARLDGSEKKTLLIAQGNLTGVAYASHPSQTG
jgi:3-hydroxyacyl-CoA dehydrogenase/DNA-binding beta-propeller fold protein YncE